MRRTMSKESVSERHDRLFKSGVEVVTRFLPGANGGAPLAVIGRERELEAACLELQEVADINPKSFSAHWFMGQALRLLDEQEEAYKAFKAAYAMGAANVDVCREFVIQCIWTGRGTEAISASQEILRRFPADAGLLANHALAQVVADEMTGAKATVQRALTLSPEDAVTKRLSSMIDDVIAGRAKRPERWPLR
jgi:tetratricopeptide (TPR) repeat protein